MLFKTAQRKKTSNLHIHINNFVITNKTCQKFLGVILDEHLNWKNHCDNIINNLNFYCYLIRNLMSIINLKEIITFYEATIESKSQYGICFWGSSSAMIRQQSVIQ